MSQLNSSVGERPAQLIELKLRRAELQGDPNIFFRAQLQRAQLQRAQLQRAQLSSARAQLSSSVFLELSSLKFSSKWADIRFCVDMSFDLFYPFLTLLTVLQVSQLPFWPALSFFYNFHNPSCFQTPFWFRKIKKKIWSWYQLSGAQLF